jgi:hypothetical protein
MIEPQVAGVAVFTVDRTNRLRKLAEWTKTEMRKTFRNISASDPGKKATLAQIIRNPPWIANCQLNPANQPEKPGQQNECMADNAENGPLGMGHHEIRNQNKLTADEEEGRDGRDKKIRDNAGKNPKTGSHRMIGRL